MTSEMTLSIAGCGDAFGSGGRFQSCYLVEAAGAPLLLDCGATSLVALARLGRNPVAIPTIVVSHLHGDHMGGLPFLLLQRRFAGTGRVPLAIWGPPGIEARLRTAQETLFPGSSATAFAADVTIHEMRAGPPVRIAGLEVTAFEVSHPSGAPSHALRLTDGTKVLAYSGDTAWVEALLDCAAAADLLLIECYRFETAAPYHLTWRQIEANLDRIGARQVVLTHLSADMLGRVDEVRDPRVSIAHDGAVHPL
jgi:ribonuclease BN (tRNA processing enzyme)